MKTYIILLSLVFLFGCTKIATYTDGKDTHTITSSHRAVIHFHDEGKKIKMTADFKKPRSGWELIFPAAFNKSSDITYETNSD